MRTLIGHSQGAELVTRLMQARFDESPEMRRRLLLAFILGAPVQVPKRGTVGGTFDTIPACSTPGEIGCFVTFRSYIAGASPEPDDRLKTPRGQEAACVNPATLDDRSLSSEKRRTARKRLSGSLMPPPAWSLGAIEGDGKSTTFMRIAGAYSAACVAKPDAHLRFLSIAKEPTAGPARAGLPSFASRRLRGGLGLHVLDMQFPMAEMVALVEARQLRR